MWILAAGPAGLMIWAASSLLPLRYGAMKDSELSKSEKRGAISSDAKSL